MDGWYEALRRIAAVEVSRLRALGVFLDEDDARQHAVVEAWCAAATGALARVVMRRRLRNEFVRKPMRWSAPTVPAVIELEDGDQIPNPELLFDDWASVDDAIAWQQLGLPAQAITAPTRQAKQQKLRRLQQSATKSLTRPFDAI